MSDKIIVQYTPEERALMQYKLLATRRVQSNAYTNGVLPFFDANDMSLAQHVSSEILHDILAEDGHFEKMPRILGSLTQEQFDIQEPISRKSMGRKRSAALARIGLVIAPEPTPPPEPAPAPVLTLLDHVPFDPPSIGPTPPDTTPKIRDWTRLMYVPGNRKRRQMRWEYRGRLNEHYHAMIVNGRTKLLDNWGREQYANGKTSKAWFRDDDGRQPAHPLARPEQQLALPPPPSVSPTDVAALWDVIVVMRDELKAERANNAEQRSKIAEAMYAEFEPLRVGYVKLDALVAALTAKINSANDTAREAHTRATSAFEGIKAARAYIDQRLQELYAFVEKRLPPIRIGGVTRMELPNLLPDNVTQAQDRAIKGATK